MKARLIRDKETSDATKEKRRKEGLRRKRKGSLKLVEDRKRPLW